MIDARAELVVLVRKVQSGDVASYEDIVKRFQGSAFAHAFSMLGDSHVAEDAVQDAFVEAYRNLGSLRSPEAFASWFNRIVATACTRIIRGNRLETVSLDEAKNLPDISIGPSERLEREEREQEVHFALQALPGSLRIVTALYYIAGLTQRDVALYMGLTETAVKKRLFEARKRLKESIMNEAKRVSEGTMPAEQVSAKVIAELVGRPRPLGMKDHPMRQVFDLIVAALPEYEVIESSEIEEKIIYKSIQERYWKQTEAYHLDAEHVLRTQTSGATLRAIRGRGAPIRLLTAGRVFRPVREDEQHLRVFNQLDGICVASDATHAKLVETLGRLLTGVLGKVETRFSDTDYGYVDHGMDVDVSRSGTWISVAGCGMLKPEMLREAGHDPERTRGFAFGLGLEHLAMVRYGVSTADELWRPPYVQPEP